MDKRHGVCVMLLVPETRLLGRRRGYFKLFFTYTREMNYYMIYLNARVCVCVRNFANGFRFEVS